MDPETSAPVLVVGAGPVGLCTAACLELQGVPCRLVEKLAEPTAQSRALGIHSRTLELLERLGTIEPFLEQGIHSHGSSINAGGKRLAHISLDELDAPYRMVLILPQSDTERILARHLESRGIEIERGTELVGLQQDADGVTARVMANGKEETIETPFLIGCDGAHSVVRKQLGLAFEGDQLPGTFILADGELESGLSRDEIHVFFHEHGVLVFFPLPSGQVRVMADYAPTETPPEEATLGEIERLLRERGPADAKFAKPDWMSLFRVSFRMAEHFAAGRVFLAGDAAHIHSPVGGQGMNTGMQDGANLAWKLALHLKGLAGRTLLNSYDVERRGNAKQLLQGTERATKVVTLRHPLAQAVRNRVVSFMSQIDVIRERLERNTAMLAVSYPPSTVITESRLSMGEWLAGLAGGESQPGLADARDFDRGPKPGERAPDVDSIAPRPGEPMRLFLAWKRDPRHQLLVFTGVATPPERLTLLADFVNDIEREHGQWIRPSLVEAQGNTTYRAPAFFDAQGEAHARYGARYECLYLVRPDGYVGFRSQPVEPAAFKQYLSKLLA